MGILFVDESGNVFTPSGAEVLVVAGVHAEGSGVRQLRRHVDKARRRSARPVAELRYRSADPRARRFFFEDDRIAPLPIHVIAVVTRINDMAAFRRKYHPSLLYEHLLHELVREAVRVLPSTPEKIHFDPSSAFASQRDFAHRVRCEFPGCDVVFTPDSLNEKGLQAADMVAGAVRRKTLGHSSENCDALERCCGAGCVELSEVAIRTALRVATEEGRATTWPR